MLSHYRLSFSWKHVRAGWCCKTLNCKYPTRQPSTCKWKPQSSGLSPTQVCPYMAQDTHCCLTGNPGCAGKLPVWPSSSRNNRYIQVAQGPGPSPWSTQQGRAPHPRSSAGRAGLPGCMRDTYTNVSASVGTPPSSAGVLSVHMTGCLL